MGPGHLTLSASFSFETRNPSGFVLFGAVPDVAYFSVDTIVNPFIFLKKYILKLCVFIVQKSESVNKKKRKITHTIFF